MLSVKVNEYWYCTAHYQARNLLCSITAVLKILVIVCPLSLMLVHTSIHSALTQSLDEHSFIEQKLYVWRFVSCEARSVIQRQRCSRDGNADASAPVAAFVAFARCSVG